MVLGISAAALPPSSAEGLPDLIVERVWAVPEEVREGEPLQFWFVVRNVGNARAGPFKIVHDTGGFLLDAWNVYTGLGAGGKVQEKFGISRLTAGAHELRVKADYEQKVGESDEGNNVGTLHIVVAEGTGHPDLVVESVELFPEEPTERTGLQPLFKVRNVGTKYSPQSWVLFELADKSHRTPLGGIWPGESQRWASFTFDPPPGQHEFRATVDPDGEIAESDESNNVFSVPLTVREDPRPPAGSVDLLVLGFSFAEDPPRSGTLFTLDIYLGNRGAAASREFTVQIRLDGEAVWDDEVLFQHAELPSTRRALSVAKAAMGEHVIRIVLDPEGKVEELDEANNVYERSVFFAGPAEIHVESFGPDPEEPKAGEPLRLKARIRNVGGEPSKATTLRWHLYPADDALAGPVVAVPSLDPQEAFEAPSAEFVLSAGQHEATVIVNSSDILTPPFDVYSNARTVKFRVAGGVDTSRSDEGGKRDPGTREVSTPVDEEQDGSVPSIRDSVEELTPTSRDEESDADGTDASSPPGTSDSRSIPTAGAFAALLALALAAPALRKRGPR